MEQNSNEISPETPEASATPETGEAVTAPKRAPRRATSKKATVTDAEQPKADEAAAGEAAPAKTTKAAATKAEAPEAAEDAATEAPKRASRARKKAAEPAAEAPAAETPATETAVTETPAVAESTETQAEPEVKKPATRRRKPAAKAEAETATEATAEASAADNAEEPAAAAAEAEAPRKRTRRATTAKAEAQDAAAAAEGTSEAERQEPAAETKTSSRRASTAKGAATKSAAAKGAAAKNAAQKSDADTAEAAEATEAAKADGKAEGEQANTDEQAKGDNRRNSRSRSRAKSQDDAEKGEAQQNNGQQNGRGNKNDAKNDKSEQSEKNEQSGEGQGQRQDRDDQQSSRSRTRQRDRKRRGQQNEDLIDPELTDEDVLLQIAGILDVLDNYAFVRTSGYLPGPSDVYVSLGQVKRYGLRKGDAIVGSIRKPAENDNGGRQKYNAIVKIDSVNGAALTEDMQRVDFAELTPLHPVDRLRLETTADKVTPRVIDLVAPIGKGQRVLVAGAQRSGKSVALQEIAASVSANHPDAHLMMVLVDERPEEVTEMERTVKGEVIASTFDRAADDHTTVAELAIERAKRLVELGHDVVVLLDSLTRLSRAYNASTQSSGRGHSNHIDASQLAAPKKLFGSARNVEHGGSLTIIATVLTETGSRADEVICEELRTAANSELRLSRELAERRMYPALNLNGSATRHEETLLTSQEVDATWKLRRALGAQPESQASEAILSNMQKTQSNAEFLALLQKSQGAL
ncbi:transcription termination factor Rho [Leucobacter sp. UCMA 4100]|uniref:transcription termination factor Rho n=1 Tax=Leucobacter sp. UCMA 4100 TaxID=2810534 RepID=UPI0022EA4BE4|nr:transcription termination factor Rho [Leucobacter sp. UCMA 4100]